VFNNVSIEYRAIYEKKKKKCCKAGQAIEDNITGRMRISCWIPENTSTLTLLNSELNPTCHLLVLLGDLRFMGPCIVSVLQYISSKMQRYTVYLYLETCRAVSRYK
jgi:hypothetical protein